MCAVRLVETWHIDQWLASAHVLTLENTRSRSYIGGNDLLLIRRKGGWAGVWWAAPRKVKAIGQDARGVAREEKHQRPRFREIQIQIASAISHRLLTVTCIAIKS